MRKTRLSGPRKTCFASGPVNHRIGRLVFGFSVGLLAAWFAYEWASKPGTAVRQREFEERAVVEARTQLQSTLGIGSLTVVDPMMPDRSVGKAYVYAAADGWEVSGYYRRDEADLWHPYLATLNREFVLSSLKISDSAMLHRDGEGILQVLP